MACSPTLGTLVIVNAVNIEGISLMGSAGFLIIFAAVNLANARLGAEHRPTTITAFAGATACLASLAALVVYAATHIPAQLGVLGGLITVAVVGEALLRREGLATRPWPTKPRRPNESAAC